MCGVFRIRNPRISAQIMKTYGESGQPWRDPLEG